jgi:hypothetical protein
MLLAVCACGPSGAETPSPSSAQLDRLVGRVALFSDPLLAQVLAAVTFPDEIPGATQWANQHQDLSGQVLAEAMRSSHLYWAPSVQALLPFPKVLDSMAADMTWTTDLGAAVLAGQHQVLNAVQRQRGKAAGFGYLKSGGYVVVSSTSDITILPLNPAYIFVPSYDPDAAFSPPRSGTSIADAILYGPAVNVGGFQPFGWRSKRWESLGSYFQPWGWGSAGIDWETRHLIINDVVWKRTQDNSRDYVHPYPGLKQAAPVE